MVIWAPSTLGVGSRELAFGTAPVTGPAGRLFEILALLVVAGFLVSAWAAWQQTSWWPTSLVATAVVAIPTALSVWNPVGNVSAMGELANVGLLAATLMPWDERFLAAH